MLLAIDTSTDLTGVALHSEAGPAASLSWRAGRRHSVQLLPAADALLLLAGVPRSALQAVGVATGPGSFTSMRVGLATAKGIATAAGIPIVGVPTLLFTAWPHRRLASTIRACLPVGRGRVALAEYGVTAAGALELTRAANLPVSEVVSSGPAVYCGELPPEVLEAAGAESEVVVPDFPERDPRVLARLCWERFAAGDTDDAASLDAVYLDRR